MQNTTNLLEQVALVYGQGTIHPFLTAGLLVHEPASGYTLPEPDAYARRMADAAEAWLEHARARSRMKYPTLISKSIHSVAFSLRHRTHDLAIPSKLSGTSKHQPALWQLTRKRVGFGTPLDVEEVRDGKRVRLVVSHEGDVLGEVQAKHVPWLRPLLAFGAGAFLTRVTGHEERFTLGCNVALGRIGNAVEALHRALGTDLSADLGGDGYGGDGYGGDGATTASDEAGIDVPRALPSGDGAAGVVPAAPDGDEEDIRFWRDADGVLRMNIPHVQKHSQSPEISYLGSGPADASLSVLCAVTSREEAEIWYQLYKHEVISRLDPDGATLTRASVRAWLDRQTGEHRA